MFSEARFNTFLHGSRTLLISPATLTWLVLSPFGLGVKGTLQMSLCSCCLCFFLFLLFSYCEELDSSSGCSGPGNIVMESYVAVIKEHLAEGCAGWPPPPPPSIAPGGLFFMEECVFISSGPWCPPRDALGRLFFVTVLLHLLHRGPLRSSPRKPSVTLWKAGVFTAGPPLGTRVFVLRPRWILWRIYSCFFTSTNILHVWRESNVDALSFNF